MPRLLVLRSAIAVAVLTVPAVAQDAPRVGRDGYREGMPAVLSPPRPPPRPAPPPETPFAAAYRRAGFPRLVLFFNRDLVDTATSTVVLQRQEVANVERDGQRTARLQDGSGSADTAAPVKEDALPIGQLKDGVPVASQAPARRLDIDAHDKIQAERRTEVSVQRQPVGARAAPLDEASQWLFETGFTARLATERVRMVDRAAAVRLASVARGGADPQLLEVAAIRDHADIAVLVRAAAMPAVPGGQLFRVTAVDTRGGTILADEVVTPPAGGTPGTLATAVGDMAAAGLMARLTTTWSPPPR